MKICAAQIQPVKGNINHNKEQHKKLIRLALSGGANLIIFPELSLTGYEPQLAEELATHPADHQWNDFQEISDQHGITIGLGLPLKTKAGICIGMVLFGPHKSRTVYLKKYLHPDEEAFFTGGQNTTGFIDAPARVALAICYELSVAEHVEEAAKCGPDVYIASVAKSAEGVAKAAMRLAQVARQYNFPVLMANCIGMADGMVCGGKTSAWNSKGVLVGQLDDSHEGVLVYDTETGAVWKQTVENKLPEIREEQ